MSLGQPFSQPSFSLTQSSAFSPTTLLPLHGSQTFPSQSHTSSSLLSEHTQGGTGNLCLLVRHFPVWVNHDEKESLLRHFGAKNVVIMGTKGRMRNCVFVTFSTTEEAKWALHKLHQLDVLGHKLTVEFAKPVHVRATQEPDTDKWPCNMSKVCDLAKDEEEDTFPPAQQHTKPPSIPIVPPPPSPRYFYPPPTSVILSNISNALASVPKLYVQVLHLMNKMNIPPPFGQHTPIPPLDTQDPYTEVLQRQSYGGSSGEDGSEIASDEEQTVKKAKHIQNPRPAPKRRAVSYKQVKSLLPSLKRRRTEFEGDFPPTAVKKIALNIPSEIIITPEMARKADSVMYFKHEPREPLPVETPPRIYVPQLPLLAGGSTAGGTGTGLESGDKDINFEPRVLNEEDGNDGERFASLEELNSHRITEKEMNEHSVFKKYSPGEPSMRLYIKNLAKQVEEKDLRYIYGRYIDWSSDKDLNAFDIRVMQTGRMKGQAFVGLPSEEIAIRALKETNGYFLQGRPITVHFARSTKAKDSAKS